MVKKEWYGNAQENKFHLRQTPKIYRNSFPLDIYGKVTPIEYDGGSYININIKPNFPYILFITLALILFMYFSESDWTIILGFIVVLIISFYIGAMITVNVLKNRLNAD